MGRGINVEFVANVDKFIGRTKDIEGALDDVADSLDDLAREGEKAGDKAGDSLKDGLDDAGDAAKKLERKFKDAYDEVKKGSKTAGRDIGKNIEDGADKASRGLDDFKDEAKDTARETAASFDGTADSLVGMVQETAANALGGFGPIGAAAGIAIAAGAGAAYTAWQEKTERIKELVASMYDDMLASGQEFLSAQFMNDAIAAIGRGEGTGAIKDMATAQRYAAAAGADLSDVLRAVSGDTDAMFRVTDALGQRYEELGPNAGSAYLELNGLRDALKETAESSTNAAATAEAVRAAQATTGDAANAWAQAQAGVNDIINDTNTALMDNGKAYADNADQLRTENVAVLNDMASQLGDVVTAAADAGVAGRDLAAVQHEQYRAFMAAAEGAGMAYDDAVKLADQYGLVPEDVRTDVEVLGVAVARGSAQDLKSDLDNLHPVEVGVTVITPSKAELAERMRKLALQVNVPVTVGVSRAGMIVQ